MQQTSGERQETRTDSSLNKNSLEPQFRQHYQHHCDLRSDLRGQDILHLDTIMDDTAFNLMPETQVGEPSVIDGSSDDQKNRAQDATYFMPHAAEVRSLQDQVIQLHMQFEDYETDISKLETDIAHVENGFVHIETDIACVRTEIACVAKMVEDAERQRTEMQQSYQRDVSKHVAHINKLDGKIRHLKAQVASLKAVKSQDKAIANSRKVSDDVIKASWRTMTYNIRSLVATILTGHSSRHDLDHHGHEDKEESCAFCQLDARQILLLQNDDIRESVVEKLVWDAVVSRIFSPNGVRFGRNWAGTPGQLLSALFNQLLEVPEMSNNPTMLFRWKAESAVMMDKVIGFNNKELNSIVDKEYRGLCAFIPHDCPNITVARKSLHQELRNIFKEATEIHRILMQSRAYFYIDPVIAEDTVHYNPEYHEAEVYETELSSKSTVLLGISPSLVKCGNADGGNYDKSNRLVKASVICD
ncbi:uncharacterized protein GLRG_11044 [Colletotrichum graminicola M1.001]|uniref:Uncharacterized protein n=1 Tax=Colletotrichum graminicola (strain M1.001 / M2 / FGSC 10212) TaxID=645133 RepID=E3QYJ8_COLGM|nr:uncharacterized protein GLRG_11044 [Colletotrichum graminicola M1.001]EFQ35936.1 hypothetical protein GLRG_11044 [Colletotrichum graminicola M1.001]